MKKIINWFNCHVMNNHDWTCKANEGIKPTTTELRDFNGFKNYAEMYCKHCGKSSTLNKRLHAN